MREAAILINIWGCGIFQHHPENASVIAIPDNKTFWDFIWENREQVAGIAHSHPGNGETWYSKEDMTTFAAIEESLGKRLYWPIVTSDSLSTFGWLGPNRYDYDLVKDHIDNNFWIDELRRISGY